MNDAENEKEKKRIKLVLKNNYHYSGEVLEETDTHYLILDKFSKKICIAKDSIATSEEVQ